MSKGNDNKVIVGQSFSVLLLKICRFQGKIWDGLSLSVSKKDYFMWLTALKALSLNTWTLTKDPWSVPLLRRDSLWIKIKRFGKRQLSFRCCRKVGHCLTRQTCFRQRTGARRAFRAASIWSKLERPLPDCTNRGVPSHCVELSTPFNLPWSHANPLKPAGCNCTLIRRTGHALLHLKHINWQYRNVNYQYGKPPPLSLPYERCCAAPVTGTVFSPYFWWQVQALAGLKTEMNRCLLSHKWSYLAIGNKARM